MVCIMASAAGRVGGRRTSFGGGEMMRRSWHLPLLLAACLGPGLPATAQPPRKDPAPASGAEKPLVPPMLLQKEALEAGNPLATYAAMLDLEPRYRDSKALAGIYDEVRLNFEEFLGLPMAGVQAMSLPALKAKAAADEAIPDGFEPEAALSVVEREARKTRVVIWAEEHHLPQTRSLFEPLL